MHGQLSYFVVPPLKAQRSAARARNAAWQAKTVPRLAHEASRLAQVLVNPLAHEAAYWTQMGKELARMRAYRARGAVYLLAVSPLCSEVDQHSSILCAAEACLIEVVRCDVLRAPLLSTLVPGLPEEANA